MLRLAAFDICFLVSLVACLYYHKLLSLNYFVCCRSLLLVYAIMVLSFVFVLMMLFQMFNACHILRWERERERDWDSSSNLVDCENGKGACLKFWSCLSKLHKQGNESTGHTVGSHDVQLAKLQLEGLKSDIQIRSKSIVNIIVFVSGTYMHALSGTYMHYQELISGTCIISSKHYQELVGMQEFRTPGSGRAFETWAVIIITVTINNIII